MEPPNLPAGFPPPGESPAAPPTGPGAYLGPPRKQAGGKPVGLAVTSFVLALFGCCAGVVPMVMSWIAMSKARRGLAGGYSVAMAAFILSVFWFLATIIGTAVLFNLIAQRDAGTGLVTEEGYLPAGEIRAGDCLDRPGRNPIFIKVVPCNMAHEAELIQRMAASPKVPESEFAALCVPAFRQYVGIAPGKSELVLMAIPVDASMFGDAPGIACLVGQKDDALIAGTLRDSRR